MIGELVGSYRIVSRLGQGGMGVVYLAEHPLLGKRAVVKQLLPELSQNQAIVQRFFNEARAATLIKHPGIVDVFDFGYLPNGSAFIVMEFLDGEALATRLEKQRPQPAEAVVLFGKQIARAVGAAHASQIIHRDLKPDNVYLVAEPDAPSGIRVKVLDFGIAKLLDTAEALRTQAGAVMGTPAYMSPEQCNGAVDLDHRTDIYALGCIFFELITGTPPFPFEGLGEILIAHMSYPPPQPSALNRACPPALEQLILEMLAKHPAQRPQTMEQVAQRLEALTQLPGTVVPLPPKTMAAVPISAVVTTMGGAAGQRASIATPPRARWPWLVGGGVVVAGGIAALIATRAESPPAALPATETCSATTPAPCTALGRSKLFGPTRDAKAAREAFELACNAGDHTACARVAAMSRTGDGGAARPADALQLAEAGCRATDAASCTVLAEIQRTRDPQAALATATTACTGGDGMGCAIATSLGASHAARARELLQPRCTSGDDEACVELATLARRDNQYAAALALLETSCTRRRHADACIDLGAMYQRGEGVPADPTRGAQLVREVTQCTSGRGDACAEQAIELARDVSERRRPEAFVDALTTACDAANGAACASLAGVYAAGERTGRDPREIYRTAATLLAAECRGGSARACTRAIAVIDAHEPSPETTAALAATACSLGDAAGCPDKLAAAACTAGNATACVARGRALLGHDVTAALVALDRACSLQLAAGCYGAVYARSRDDRSAYTALCDKQNALACSAAAVLAFQAKDTARALSLADKGCSLGDLQGCQALIGMVHGKDASKATVARTRACLLGFAPACPTAAR